MTMTLERCRWICVAAFTTFLQISSPASVIPQVPEGSSVSFAAAGDFGMSEDVTATLRAMADAEVDFVMALGDLSYSGPGSEPRWCAYAQAFFPANFPFQILVGNHEDDYGVDGHITRFADCLPDRMGAVGTYGVQYYFDYAGLARFILISQDLTVDGQHYYYGEDNEQYRWLASTIDDARDSGIPWVIVGMHKSCLSMGPYYCSIYQDLMSLLVEKKVDLVLHGHEHDYQRTHQLATGPDCEIVEVDAFNPDCVIDDGTDGLYRRGAGLVSLIVGTAGIELYDLDLTDAEAGYFARWMAANANPQKGFVKVTVSRAELTAVFVGTTPTSDFTDGFTIGLPL